MPELFLTTREGEEKRLQGADGLTVMEVIRDGGVDELLALCGGCCSCATCHVYVSGEVASDLRPPSDDEDELLESSSHRLPSSRLSCQLPFSTSVDGLRVVIAPED